MSVRVLRAGLSTADLTFRTLGAIPRMPTMMSS
jgi:hypothetical protein